jgi:hypothetical protein
MKRRDAEMKIWVDLFNSKAVEFLDDCYVEADLLRILFDSKMRHIEKHIRDALFSMMSYEGQQVIKLSHYKDVMLAMACFSATDINNDNVLDIDELKNLFWLSDGKEPENAKVQKEMLSIDKDLSGEVDRLEWIAYLVSPDPESGGSYFDFDLRETFLRIDKNCDGFIN